jgi:hypothetical protein
MVVGAAAYVDSVRGAANSVEWDDHEDGQKHLSDGEEVVICWLSFRLPWWWGLQRT